MKLTLIFTVITSILLLSGCSSYISRMHKEFDRSDGKKVRKIRRDRFALYRGKNGKRLRKRSGRLSTKRMKRLSPAVKRNYRPNRSSRKRFSADDMTDRGGGGSLWAGTGKDNYLFSRDIIKKIGDIVVINVQKELKNEITMELKRAFPKRKKRRRRKLKKGAKAPEAAPPPATTAEKATGETSKIHDKISGIVVEELNKEHLLLRGRKDILFRNRKRMVEIQALVSRRSITDDSNVNSDDLLESDITILR